MEKLITVATWLSVLGVPSFGALFVLCIGTYHKLIILHNAQKAQMRNQLMMQYDQLIKEETIEAAYFNEFENQYKAYHKLVGENQVLDDRYAKLIDKFNSQQH